jgi:hypothetical protein
VTAWTAHELDRIAAGDELEVAPLRADGQARRPVPIWVVRVGDDLYVRSWRGGAGDWFRAVQARGEGQIIAGGVTQAVTFVRADADVEDAVDAAYRSKYARYPSYVAPMLGATARATTLRVLPRATGMR